jgi:predicted phage tail protein
MKTVILRGELGEKFGRTHSFDLNTPAEAIRALSANFQQFESELVNASDRGIGYVLHVGEDPLQSIDEIDYPTGQLEAISITPVLQGAGGGGGLGQVFAGIGLIAAAIVLGPIGAAIGLTSAPLFAAGTGVATAIGYVGAAMVLGGTAQLLSPALTTGPRSFGATGGRAPARESFSPRNNEPADNRASYIFNGAVNLTAQGNPVPICYGRMRVGSVVVSAGLSTEDIS